MLLFIRAPTTQTHCLSSGRSLTHSLTPSKGRATVSQHNRTQHHRSARPAHQTAQSKGEACIQTISPRSSVFFLSLETYLMGVRQSVPAPVCVCVCVCVYISHLRPLNSRPISHTHTHDPRPLPQSHNSMYRLPDALSSGTARRPTWHTTNASGCLFLCLCLCLSSRGGIGASDGSEVGMGMGLEGS